MDKEQHTETKYTYDTPANLILKEGDFFRNLSSSIRKPLWLRVCIILFTTLILLLPGITFVILSIITFKYYETPLVSQVAGLTIGVFFIALGISIIRKNTV